MISENKLKILVESAKFDVSCSSSGSNRKSNRNTGNTCFGGICHSFTEDGRCVSLLKILMTNICSYNCLYCNNRCNNDGEKAIATPTEICELTIEFYKRNYIEGLFLSSAVYKNPNYTMELLLDTVIKLRKLYNFNGYIHLKGIPGCDPTLIMRAGEYVDRMSFNLELPSEKSLRLLAPQKSKKSIITPMSLIHGEKECFKGHKSKFLPAGQTTQMIVGASSEKDHHILTLTEALYRKYKLKRVYYSSYVPVNTTTSLLPKSPTGLLREHRLYQADWLIRFYGFNVNELIHDNENLSLEYDPKCAWALSHPEMFPVEINTAPVEVLVRVPGIGLKSAYKIVSARKYGSITLEGLRRMKIPLKRSIHFITLNGFFSGLKSEINIKASLLDYKNNENIEQLSMFSSTNILSSVLLGEL